MLGSAITCLKTGFGGSFSATKISTLDSLTLTSSVPLVLSCSVAVVLVSSLEIKWKNLIHQSGSDFTVIFSRFLVSVSKLDFQRSSRNLVFTLIFPSKMIFCQIFLYFPRVLESTTTSQLESTNGFSEVTLRLSESRKWSVLPQAEKLQKSLVLRHLMVLLSSTPSTYEPFISLFLVGQRSLPPV